MVIHNVCIYLSRKHLVPACLILLILVKSIYIHTKQLNLKILTHGLMMVYRLWPVRNNIYKRLGKLVFQKVIKLTKKLLTSPSLSLTSTGRAIYSTVGLATQPHVTSVLPLKMILCEPVKEHIDGILPKGPYPPCLRMADWIGPFTLETLDIGTQWEKNIIIFVPLYGTCWITFSRWVMMLLLLWLCWPLKTDELL